MGLNWQAELKVLTALRDRQPRGDAAQSVEMTLSAPFVLDGHRFPAGRYQITCLAAQKSEG